MVRADLLLAREKEAIVKREFAQLVGFTLRTMIQVEGPAFEQ
jgi:DNA-binding XRE family transcriptional regulator